MTESNQPHMLPLVHSSLQPTFGSYAASIVKGRAAIGRHFNAELFADPAFDIMLGLFAAGEERRKVTVSDCALLARIPPTTGLRWLARLESEGIVSRYSDPADGRRVFVDLTERARSSLQTYLASISSIPLRR